MNQLARLALALGLSLLTAGPVSAADKWILVATDHFDVVGNTRDSDLRLIGQTLEHFHEVVVSAVLRDPGSSGARATVLVFKNDFSFAPYKPQGAGRSSIGALFFLGEQPLLALNAEDLTYAFRIVLNGYAQTVTARLSGDVPAWLSSGIGQVYETFEERNGGKGALIGRPDANEVSLLKTATLLPLARLLALDRSSPGMTLGTPSRRLFDAQSWALAHYLSFGPRQAQLKQFLTALHTGAPADKAFRDAFGDLAVLEHELFDYIRKFLFPAMQVVFAEKVKPSLPPRGEVLGEADAEAYLSVLLRGSGYATQARTRLEKALAAAPNSARATAALAQLDLSENQVDRGLAGYAKAAELDPGSARIQREFGHHLSMEVMRKGRSATSDDLSRARAALTRAIELDPDNVDATAELGWMLLYQPDDSARAETLLTKAARMAPNQDQYRLWLADALLRQRKYSDARTLLGPLLALGSSPGIRTSARELLGGISRMQREDEARATGASSSPAQTSPLSSTSSAPALAPVSSTTNTDAADTSRTTPAGGVAPIPALRRVEPGETRVLGLFSALDCTGGALVLSVQVDGRMLNFSAKQFSDIQFITYRQTTPTAVACGLIRPVQRVLATYRPGAQPDAPIAGVAVAIELLPDGYTPP